ncbi:hypothetical protein ADJ73_08865 [Arsenicicoccus sp. oral taxon 190]|nr:hypothetical protein ADJ73_08865 [Arsenicicoccus sp. oral taxon 190]
MRLVSELEPVDAREDQVRADLLAHLDRHPDAWWKYGPPAHFTASVLVLSEDRRQVLLTHHRKARTWFQLGGHAEPGDLDVVGVARREGREESGIPDLQVSPRLVDVDRHALGTGFAVCREHLDLRFVAVVGEVTPVVSHESLDVAWWPVDALPHPHGEELPRLIERAGLRVP